jgi:NAD(P)-binding Rossmann-like domain
MLVVSSVAADVRAWHRAPQGHGGCRLARGRGPLRGQGAGRAGVVRVQPGWATRRGAEVTITVGPAEGGVIIKEHFDAIVVGSGFGGSVVAYRLAEAGLSVCLLERGKAYPPGSFPRSYERGGVLVVYIDPKRCDRDLFTSAF